MPGRKPLYPSKEGQMVVLSIHIPSTWVALMKADAIKRGKSYSQEVRDCIEAGFEVV
jgi:hypothetical protein